MNIKVSSYMILINFTKEKILLKIREKLFVSIYNLNEDLINWKNQKLR